MIGCRVKSSTELVRAHFSARSSISINPSPPSPSPSSPSGATMFPKVVMPPIAAPADPE